MADSICACCFHNYVCEKFNENRDYKNQECRYFNSHFVDMDSVEPVRHGHWEKYGIDIPEHPWHCSECGWSDHHIEQRRIQEFKACPNCGAKMDEVTPNDT